MDLIFSADFPKKMKRSQVGAESFQVDGHDAGSSSFSQFYDCTQLLKDFLWNLLMTWFVDIFHSLVLQKNITFSNSMSPEYGNRQLKTHYFLSFKHNVIYTVQTQSNSKCSMPLSEFFRD